MTSRQRAHRLYEAGIIAGFVNSWVDPSARTGSVYVYLRRERDGPAFKVRFGDHPGMEGGYDLDANEAARVLSNRQILAAANLYIRKHRSNPTTDRAKRYAANRHVTDDKRHGCLFCGSKKFLTVDHLSGDESDGNPANLAWLCKSCNTRKGAAFRKAGIGRLTHQYNPDLGLSPQERKNFEQMGFEFAPRPRERHGRPARKEATAEDRRRKSARLAGLNEARTLRRRAQAQALYDSGRRMNPARIASASQWSEAVAAVLGKPSSMGTGTAAARIRATTPAARRKFSAAVR